MIILLTGMQSLNKKFLSRIIIAQTNNFPHKNYKCDFSQSSFIIYDENNNIVHEPATDNTEGVPTLILEDKEAFLFYQELNKRIFEDGVKHSHFIDVFTSVDVEYGLTNTAHFERIEHKLLHPSKYSDVVNNIKNTALNTKVISGTFGNKFIDKIKNDFPNEEVIVLNIIRNPSASLLLNKKPESKWETEINPDLTEDIDWSRFNDSILNTIELMKNKDIITIKFEDIMNDLSLQIGDFTIKLTDGYESFNDWINIAESQMDIIMSEDEYIERHEKLKNLKNNYYIKDEDDEMFYGKTTEQILSILNDKIPNDIFKAIGYEPLSYTEILTKK